MSRRMAAVHLHRRPSSMAMAGCWRGSRPHLRHSQRKTALERPTDVQFPKPRSAVHRRAWPPATWSEVCDVSDPQHRRLEIALFSCFPSGGSAKHPASSSNSFMRVLIATVTAGAGHLQAAAALEQAWRELRPGDAVEKVDLLDFVSGLQRNVYVQGYVKLVKHAPELWGMVFKKTDNPALLRKVGRLRRSFAGRTNRDFVRHLRRFRPDAVLCTHYLPVEIMAHLERKGFNPLTVCVVTDFEAHALWMEPAVDLYCVAASETLASVVARGARPADVTVTGIPIAAKFSEPVDPRAVRRRYGLRDHLPVILVLGGGFGMGPVAGILSALNQVGRECQVLVVGGSNARRRREVACADFRPRTRVLGFVTNMHELMTAADLIVTKPGGLTSSEALALGKPMF